MLCGAVWRRPRTPPHDCTRCTRLHTSPQYSSRLLNCFGHRKDLALSVSWLRGLDLNQRPLGYEPNELPDCSTPQSQYTRIRTLVPTIFSPISRRSDDQVLNLIRFARIQPLHRTAPALGNPSRPERTKLHRLCSVGRSRVVEVEGLTIDRRLTHYSKPPDLSATSGCAGTSRWMC